MGNAVTLLGTSLSAPTSSDPNLCRISGYLKNVQGQPLKGCELVIRHVYMPQTLEATILVLSERQSAKSDRTGFIQFDVVRKATVVFEVPNREFDANLRRVIPDTSSADLVDVLFPYVSSVAVDQTEISAAVGDSVTVTGTATLSNGQEVVLTSSMWSLTSSDESVLKPQAANSAAFSALTAGTALLTPLSVDQEKVQTAAEVTDTSGELFTMFDLPDPTFVPSTPILVTIS